MRYCNLVELVEFTSRTKLSIGLTPDLPSVQRSTKWFQPPLHGVINVFIIIWEMKEFAYFHRTMYIALAPTKFWILHHLKLARFDTGSVVMAVKICSTTIPPPPPVSSMVWGLIQLPLMF